MMQTNEDTRVMEDSMTKTSLSVTDLKPVARGSYETVKSGAWKTWHDIPHSSTKGVGNKIGGYTSAYAPQSDCNKSAERKG